jgi:hypothetical protein
MPARRCGRLSADPHTPLRRWFAAFSPRRPRHIAGGGRRLGRYAPASRIPSGLDVRHGDGTGLSSARVAGAVAGAVAATPSLNWLGSPFGRTGARPACWPGPAIVQRAAVDLRGSHGFECFHIVCPCRQAHARRVRPGARSTICRTVPEPRWGWLGDVDAQNQCEGAFDLAHGVRRRGAQSLR